MRKSWSHDSFFDEDGKPRSSLLDSRVSVVDQGGSTYYGSVADVIVDSEFELWIRAKYDKIRRKKRVDGKMTWVESEVEDDRVWTIRLPH